MNFMFNLEDYEDVAARVLRFQKAYPEGRIVTDVIQFDPEKGIVLISAQIYRNGSDTLPAGVDYAFGDVSTYNSGMRKWYVEDTSSSSIGRALSLVLETQKKPTKQDMAKVVTPRVIKPPVQDLVQAIQAADKETAEQDYWTTPVNDYMKVVDAPVTLEKAMANVAAIIGTGEAQEAPSCKHGHMRWRDGEKNGRAWGGYQCAHMNAGGVKSDCPPAWYRMGSDGKWHPQEVRV
jgi:hypothetical protein